MPEREISPSKAQEIAGWVNYKKGLSVDGFYYPSGAKDEYVYIINGEPLAIFKKRDLILTGRGPVESSEERIFVSCSDKHAGELEEAGIVDFLEQTEPQK